MDLSFSFWRGEENSITFLFGATEDVSVVFLFTFLFFNAVLRDGKEVLWNNSKQLFSPS